MIVGLVLCFVFFCTAESFVVQPWAGKHGCNDPSYWCKDKETAKECGVIEYCKIEWGKVQSTDFIFKRETGKKEVAKTDAAAVKITLYYESLCPGCRGFIKSQLYPTYQKLQSSGILDVEFVPFGNAQERQYGSKWEFFCQHGQAECLGNLIESCAINLLGKLSVYAPFLACLENYEPTDQNARYCASYYKIDYSKISTCVSGEQGNMFEHQMALKTKALNPPHKYVPWITVNGVHTDASQSAVQSNMLAYVCSIYQGAKPAACTTVEKKHKDVCYKD